MNVVESEGSRDKRAQCQLTKRCEFSVRSHTSSAVCKTESHPKDAPPAMKRPSRDAWYIAGNLVQLDSVTLSPHVRSAAERMKPPSPRRRAPVVVSCRSRVYRMVPHENFPPKEHLLLANQTTAGEREFKPGESGMRHSGFVLTPPHPCNHTRYLQLGLYDGIPQKAEAMHLALKARGGRCVRNERLGHVRPAERP